MSDQICFMKLRVATLQLPERGGKQQTHTHSHECENQQLPTMPLAKDLLNPSFDFERRQHKKKRLVQSPNSYFMDVVIRSQLCLVMHRQLCCVLGVQPFSASQQEEKLG
ncbi:40S ribosomal protein S27 [Pimephales promelas]|nr:40S ribosomal protein S27 [Pimephales promelas]